MTSSGVVLIALFAVACTAEKPRAPAVTAMTSATDSTGDVRPNPDSAVGSDVNSAVDVVRRYYEAINVRRYGEAYAMWGDNGNASGQTPSAFVDGFSNTATSTVQIGVPGRIEGAAGSRYIDVPVVVLAVLNDGTEQRFVGAYQLKRVVVDGATGAQRAWHLYSARLEPSPR